MTNEELALLIQAGHTEHYGELWERCRKLLFVILARYQKRVVLPNYISGEDLEQCLFAALQAAVRSYDSGKGFLFSSYLRYHVMNAVQAQLPDQRIAEISANQPAEDDEGDSAELQDFIADESAASAFDHLELSQLRATVRQAVAALPEKPRVCITLSFFEGLTYRRISERTGYSIGTVTAAVHKGLCLLRKDKTLCALYD